MTKKRLTFSEQLEMEDQFPEETPDVFEMYVDTEPKNTHVYLHEPSREDTVVFRLEKDKYPTLQDARNRAFALFPKLQLKPYRQFNTVRCWVWHCTKGDK